MIYLLCRKFFIQASTVKNYTNATNLSQHLSMNSNNLLVFLRHVLSIGRGPFFRLHNSNCIGHFASLLRTPWETMFQGLGIFTNALFINHHYNHHSNLNYSGSRTLLGPRNAQRMMKRIRMQKRVTPT